MFLIDKFNLNNTDDIFFHEDIIRKLDILAQDDCIPHLIFYGDNGVGKKTLINYFLTKLFDETVHNIRNVTYSIENNSKKKEDIEVKQSNYHLVIEPNNNNKDKYLIQGIIKEYVKLQPLKVFKTKRNFKVIFITNIDNLFLSAQDALRRTMEIYSDSCRFVIMSRSINKVSKPIQSRCYKLRIPSPLDDNLVSFYRHVSEIENINVSESELQDIVVESYGNVKTGLWELELLKHGCSRGSNIYFQRLDEIIEKMIQKKIKNIVAIRDMIHKIIVTNISEEQILIDLIIKLVQHPNIINKSKIIDIGNHSDYLIIRKRRDILHLETFVIKIMRIL